MSDSKTLTCVSVWGICGRGLSRKDQLDWTKAVQLTKHTDLEKNVLLYLKKSSKNERVVNFPCYINEKIVGNSKKLIKKY